MMYPSLISVVVFAVLLPQINTQDCVPKTFKSESFVCVCNATYCDFPGEINAPSTSGDYVRVISDRDSQRFNVVSGSSAAESKGDVVVHVNHNYEYQKMFGFGGAFTDATGINLASLPKDAQDMAIKSYFAPEGIEYNLCRIPVGGSDFSTRPYSYDDTPGDVSLDHFALEPEDIDYKLPYIHKAIEASSEDIWLMGSPWSPPSWMKDTGMFNGTGSLLKEHWDPYAKYIVKFVEAYESQNLTLWGLTPQNEPLWYDQDWTFNTCSWDENEMRDFIRDYLGPTLTAAGLRRLKLMNYDFNRDGLTWYPKAVLQDTVANDFIDGTAVHWYSDEEVDANVLDELQSMFPDKFILYTEACDGWKSTPEETGVHLGEWQRAEHYAADIIENVNHHSTGWIDWNMALSMTGGPNWANNFVDSPLITDPENEVFYKQPTFYAMGHFSKFIQRDARRVYTGIDKKIENLDAATFHNPDGTTTYILLNKGEDTMNVSVQNADGTFVNLELGPKSLESILIRGGKA